MSWCLSPWRDRSKAMLCLLTMCTFSWRALRILPFSCCLCQSSPKQWCSMVSAQSMCSHTGRQWLINALCLGLVALAIHWVVPRLSLRWCFMCSICALVHNYIQRREARGQRREKDGTTRERTKKGRDEGNLGRKETKLIEGQKERRQTDRNKGRKKERERKRNRER